MTETIHRRGYICHGCYGIGGPTGKLTMVDTVRCWACGAWARGEAWLVTVMEVAR